MHIFLILNLAKPQLFRFELDSEELLSALMDK